MNMRSNDFVNREIKWTSELEDHMKKGSELIFKAENIINSIYRPFVKSFLYFSRIIIHRPYQNEHFYGRNAENINTSIAVNTNQKDFDVLANNFIPNNHFVGDSQCLPLYRYDEKGNRIDNITDWGQAQFVKHYGDEAISKEDIFHYTYAVLHNPAYRRKYEQNLKREFPRLPFYVNFTKWAAWGRALMDLHLNYETVEPFPSLKIKIDNEKSEPKAKLKAFPELGEIVLDENTTISGIPPEAWNYKLGNRSALHWILDQYKEKKPSDPTIAERFNTYRFADYKAVVIDLLQRLTTVSVRTMEIVSAIENENEI
jgi:predicted helicase